jgi:5-methylthioribose kinase
MTASKKWQMSWEASTSRQTALLLFMAIITPEAGSKTAKGFRIIDPEFCFFGRPEFELGVAVAHLKMAQQPDALIKDLFIYYHFDKQFDGSLFTKFAGIEIIRRLIGVAQLPLELTLQERLDLLEEARALVVKG